MSYYSVLFWNNTSSSSVSGTKDVSIPNQK